MVANIYCITVTLMYSLPKFQPTQQMPEIMDDSAKREKKKSFLSHSTVSSKPNLDRVLMALSKKLSLGVCQISLIPLHYFFSFFYWECNLVYFFNYKAENVYGYSTC